MKKISAQLIKITLLLLVMLAVLQVNAQRRYSPLAISDINLTLRNDVQSSTISGLNNVLEFDVYLQDMDAATPFELATVQAGIVVNPAIYNGGTITLAIIPGSSQLGSAQQPSSVIWALSQNTIKLTPRPGPGAGNGTIISTTAPGTRVCRLRMTNTVGFSINTTANLTVNFTTSPYPTKVNQYIGGLNTQITTNASNCFSLLNNIFLNAPQWTGATSINWTDAGNWTNGVPAAGSSAIIATAANQPTIATTVSLSAITVNSGAVLTIGSAGKVTVTNSLTNNAMAAGLVVKSGGSLITTGTVTGLATVESTFPTLPGGEWHMISPPVSDATANTFLGMYLQEHIQSTNLWSDIKLTDTPLLPLKGYAVFTPGAYTANYTGTLNTGAIGISNNMTRTNSGANSGWNLVGNPYPSAIDWDAASGWTKTNVNPAIYVQVNSALWATYIAGVGNNGGSRYIAPCQGFFVQVANGFSTGTLAINNSVRVHNDVPFYKSAVSNLVRLQVSGNGYSDEAVVRIMPEATAEFDGDYDAVKLFGDVAGAAQLYSLGSSALAINAIPEPTLVPIGMRVGKSGTYTIAATEINDLTYITLEDSKTGIFTDLKSGSYSFSFKDGENEQRFVLHFNALSVNDVEKSFANIYSNSCTVYIDLMGNTKGDISVYTIAGQLVATIPAAQGSNKINLANTGNYIVKIISDKNTVVKKVFVK